MTRTWLSRSSCTYDYSMFNLYVQVLLIVALNFSFLAHYFLSIRYLPVVVHFWNIPVIGSTYGTSRSDRTTHSTPRISRSTFDKRREVSKTKSSYHFCVCCCANDAAVRAIHIKRIHQRTTITIWEGSSLDDWFIHWFILHIFTMPGYLVDCSTVR